MPRMLSADAVRETLKAHELQLMAKVTELDNKASAIKEQIRSLKAQQEALSGQSWEIPMPRMSRVPAAETNGAAQPQKRRGRPPKKQ